ncbi:MAG: DUF4296 domain-containing protein [Bacteroidales bacterium]|nr:DUF4296 domain-containing protein [Bacteroidales bacterium]
MRLIRRIMLMTAVFLLAVSCGRKEDKVIPRSKLAEIYAEMLLVDQWIMNNPGNRHIADTSLVYEPVLERYGYTSADYRKSVDVYMNDPERFSRILRTTAEILGEKLNALEDQKKEIEHQEALRKLRESLKIKVEIDMGEYFPYLDEEPYVHYYDSLAVEPDSLWIYRMRNIDRADTIYRDLRMVILDSLQVRDTVTVKDTISVK